MAENVFCEVTVILTFQDRNLISSFSSPDGCLSQIRKGFPQGLLRHHVFASILLRSTCTDFIRHEFTRNEEH